MYVILSYYNDGSGFPNLNFTTDPQELVTLAADDRGLGKEIEIYRIINDNVETYYSSANEPLSESASKYFCKKGSQADDND